MNDFLARFGPWAVVTGASSGIGEAFARQLAAKGIHLVLVARREDRLQRLAEELRETNGVETRIVPVDLAGENFLPVVEQATNDLEIGLLVNNAGVLSAGRFLDHDLRDELNQLNVNTRAVLTLAHHFGRRMRERRRGGVIFLASTVAFAGVPGMSAYAASKAHVLSFAEGFAAEVAGDGIAVLALCPGPTSTEIWPTGATPSLPMRPEAVADLALRKLGKRTTTVAGLLEPTDYLLHPLRPQVGELPHLRQGGRRNAEERHAGLRIGRVRPVCLASNNCVHGMTHGLLTTLARNVTGMLQGTPLLRPLTSPGRMNPRSRNVSTVSFTPIDDRSYLSSSVTRSVDCPNSLHMLDYPIRHSGVNASFSDTPKGVKEYSTLGGISGYALRWMIPSASNSFNCWISTFSLIPWTSRLSSPNRRRSVCKCHRISGFHLPPITSRAASRPQW